LSVITVHSLFTYYYFFFFHKLCKYNINIKILFVLSSIKPVLCRIAITAENECGQVSNGIGRRICKRGSKSVVLRFFLWYKSAPNAAENVENTLFVCVQNDGIVFCKFAIIVIRYYCCVYVCICLVGWLVRFSPPVLRPSVRAAKKLFQKITTDPFYCESRYTYKWILNRKFIRIDICENTSQLFHNNSSDYTMFPKRIIQPY